MLAYPADWPVPLNSVQLRGAIVQLELLAPEHEAHLLRICQQPQIWSYLTTYGGSAEAMHRYVSASLQDYASGTALPFIIRTASDGSVVGMTRLKNVSREHRKATVGSWLIPSAWGRGANTEAKLLLLEHAFETLNCIRIEFHTDSRNLRSRAALAKMGARWEGTLRSYSRTRDGHRRDTIVFSILDSEWPKAKDRLQRRLEVQLLTATRQRAQASARQSRVTNRLPFATQNRDTLAALVTEEREEHGMSVDDFARYSSMLHRLTTDFVRAVPEDKWDFTPDLAGQSGHAPAPRCMGHRLAPFCKQLRHVVCVRGVYNAALAARKVNWERKHDHYTGPLTRDALLAALDDKQRQLLATLKTIDIDALIDWGGTPFTFALFTWEFVQHEAIHHGQWSTYASLAGFVTPLSWRTTWGL